MECAPCLRYPIREKPWIYFYYYYKLRLILFSLILCRVEEEVASDSLEAQKERMKEIVTAESSDNKDASNSKPPGKQLFYLNKLLLIFCVIFRNINFIFLCFMNYRT